MKKGMKKGMEKGMERRFSYDLCFGFRGDSLCSLGIEGRHADPRHEPCEGGSGRPDRLGIPVREAGRDLSGRSRPTAFADAADGYNFRLTLKWIRILWAYFQLALGTDLSSRSAQIAA